MRHRSSAEQRHFDKAKARRIADLEASVAFFAAANKPARERWVIRELLRNLGTRHAWRELISVPAREEPPDVRFRTGRFEIKEALDNNRQRHREFKEALERARQARTMRQLYRTTGYSPIEVPLSDLVGCAQTLGGQALHRYGSRVGGSLDLVIYYNLLDVIGLRPSLFPRQMPPEVTAWRSVSILFGRRSIVLHVANGAPRFIALARRRVRLRK